MARSFSYDYKQKELNNMHWCSAVFSTIMVCVINFVCLWVHILFVDLLHNFVWIDQSEVSLVLWEFTFTPFRHMGPLRDVAIDTFVQMLNSSGFSDFLQFRHSTLFSWVLIYHIRRFLSEMFGELYFLMILAGWASPQYVNIFCSLSAIFGHLVNAWDFAQEIIICIEIFGQYLHKQSISKNCHTSTPFRLRELYVDTSATCSIDEWGSWFVLYDIRSFEDLAKEYGWKRVLYCLVYCFSIDILGFLLDLTILCMVRPQVSCYPMNAWLVYCFNESTIPIYLYEEISELYYQLLKISGFTSLTQFQQSIFFNFTCVFTLSFVGVGHYLYIFTLIFIGNYCYPKYFSCIFGGVISFYCVKGLLEHFLQLLVGLIKLLHLHRIGIELCINKNRIDAILQSMRSAIIGVPLNNTMDFFITKPNIINVSTRQRGHITTVVIQRESTLKDQNGKKIKVKDKEKPTMASLAQVLADQALRPREPYKPVPQRFQVEKTNFIDHSSLDKYNHYILKAFHKCHSRKCLFNTPLFNHNKSSGVSKMFLKCRGCLSVYFCSEKCLEDSWRSHKHECKVLFKNYRATRTKHIYDAKA